MSSFPGIQQIVWSFVSAYLTNSWLMKCVCDIYICILLITKYFFFSVCNINYVTEQLK